MKPRTVPLDRSFDPQTVAATVLRVRLAEFLECMPALTSGESADLHDLRIACKRLRYAMELFATVLPGWAELAAHFRALQDELGSVHDSDVLSALAAKCGAIRLQRRIARDRTAMLKRASARCAGARGQEAVCDFGESLSRISGGSSATSDAPASPAPIK